jgi:hypothetical protein
MRRVIGLAATDKSAVTESARLYWQKYQDQIASRACMRATATLLLFQKIAL